jgi:RNA polymerase sigma-70 factor (ECF subfamily)
VAEEVQADRFASHYAGCHVALLRFVLTLVPDRHQAEDVVQETARVLWQKFAEYDPAKPFWPWARQVAHFEALKFRKKQSTARKRFADDLVETLASERARQEDLLEERCTALRKCLEALPEEDRKLLAERYEGAQAVEELARRRGRSANALYLTMHRIRRRLIECVGRTLRLEGWA